MSFDADAQDYIDRVIAVDGFMWPHVQEAINRFVVGCKADASPFSGVSNWDAIKACCLFAGVQSFTASMVPLKGPSPSIAGGTCQYNPANGIKGIGTNFYMSSGWMHDNDPQNNLHAYVRITEPDQGSASSAYISSQAYSSTSRLLQVQSGGHGFLANGLGGTVAATFGEDGDRGGLGVSRHNASEITRYSFGATSISSVASSPPASQMILLFRRQASGINSTSARLCFYSLGEAVNLASLDRRVERFMRDIVTPARRGFPMSRLVN